MTVIFTLIGGLILAGILGWIRRARLVVFVPRLFSHSKISDKGQIAELSVMNRGFKTEEGVELILNPAMHYELLGSNNPDALLLRNKLSVPRIGSADDCSVLLQVENGRFTYSDIVSCLSKETKATVATKLEDVPVTAQQRVGIIVFSGLFLAIILGGLKGVDYFIESNSVSLETKNVEQTPADHQGWNISKIYAGSDNIIYQSIISRKITILAGAPSLRKNILVVPMKIINESDVPITINASISGALPQDNVDFDKRMVNRRLLLPKDSMEATLEAIVPKEVERQTVVVELFLQTPQGESLKGVKIVRVASETARLD